MLILEGSDLVGKTTLSKTLLTDDRLQHDGYTYGWLSRLPSGFDRVWGYDDLIKRRRVQDRLHMSEVAYCIGREDAVCPLQPEDYALVDSLCVLQCGFMVVLTASPELIKKRYGPRAAQEMYGVDLVLKVNEVFREAVSRGYISYPRGPQYRVTIDFHLHFTESQPFPTDADVERLLVTYNRRLNRWHSAMRRRSQHIGSAWPVAPQS